MTSKVYCLQIDCHLKHIQVWGVSEEFPCIIVIVNHLFLLLIIEAIQKLLNLKFSES